MSEYRKLLQEFASLPTLPSEYTISQDRMDKLNSEVVAWFGEKSEGPMNIGGVNLLVAE